jgi:hypothetical protein
MAGRIFATDLPFSEPWRDCEDTRCRRHQGELFATADERAIPSRGVSANAQMTSLHRRASAIALRLRP